jgi:F-type H+-transporting ATPase subunit epsilon
MLLDVTILSPKEILFEGQAKSIIFPGEQGVFEVLAYHKPLLSRLISGIMLVDDKSFPIRRGIVKVNKNKVTVIVEQNT